MKYPRILLPALSLVVSAATAFSADATKASTIIVPKVTFRGASVWEGLDFLRKKSREIDPGHSGVNMILVPWEGMDQVKVDLDLANVPLDAAVGYFAQIANLEVTKVGDTLILARKDRVHAASLFPSKEKVKSPRVIVPKIELRGASVREGVDFLKMKSVALDPQKSRMNIVLVPWEGMEKTTIDLNLVNETLDSVIGYLALIANLEATLDGDTLILARKNRIQPGVFISTGGMKAASLRAPKLELREATVEEALNFIRYKANALDPAKTGVNIVLVPSDKVKEATVTLSLTNISIADAVRYVALIANLDLKRDGETFILKAAD